jgi:ABC-type sugar transport system permease subunit
LYILIIPSLVLVAMFSYYPTLSAIYHSFFEWNGGIEKRFVGLDNFRRALTDSVLWGSFITVTFLILFNLVKMVPSIAMAVVINRMRSDSWQYRYRVLLVLPMVVPGIVTLLIWKFFLDSNLGILNWLINATGFKHVLVWMDGLFGWDVFSMDMPIGWLSQPELILPSLFIWGFPWIGAVGVLIYLAGLQAIGDDVYEAARIEGIGPFQQFFYIELPLILTQVRLMLILLVISTIQGYGLQLLLFGTGGGPSARGMVPGLWMYNRAFLAGEFGYACAIGIVLFVFIGILTYINVKYVRVEK